MKNYTVILNKVTYIFIQTLQFATISTCIYLTISILFIDVLMIKFIF